MKLIQLCLSKSWGGLEMSALRYSQLLSERGYESVCASPVGSPLTDAAQKANVAVSGIPKSPRLWPFKTIFALRKLLRSTQPDFIFVHHLKDLTYLVPALLGLPKIKLIGFSHMLVSRPKKDLLHRYQYSFLQKMIVFTDAQRKLALPMLPIAAEKYAVIPGFVDMTTFHPGKRSEALRASWGVAPDEVLIGLIGRLDFQKGQAEFLEALALVQNAEPALKWKAILIGAVTASEETKGYPAHVRALVQSLGLEDRVNLVGYLSDPSVAMASLDLFCLPSYRETFGLVVLEAMASGVPTLVTDAGGPPEIVGTTGLTFKPRDAQSLADTLLVALKDRARLTQLSAAALARVKSVYSRNVIGDQLEEVLK